MHFLTKSLDAATEEHLPIDWSLLEWNPFNKYQTQRRMTPNSWQGCFKTHLNLRGEYSICSRHVGKFLRLIDVFLPVFARVSPFWSHKSLTKLQERLT